LNPIDPEDLKRKLQNGLKNPNPKSGLAWALKRKVTVRFGNKIDPFQPIEETYKVSEAALRILSSLKWPYVVQTRNTYRFIQYEEIVVGDMGIFVFQPIISPGAEMDWEILERKRTTPIKDRFKHIQMFKKQGVKVAVNGEPFIPGFHTIKMFEDMIKRLKSAGVKNYNTYNFHFNDFVAKRLLAIKLDIEKIWEMNQDKNWKPILHQLCEIANKYDIILGCPDFVNVPKERKNETNTCCGINVQTPTTYNTHTWRNMLLAGIPIDQIIEKTWDGIGNKEEGLKILMGEGEKMYTMADAGLVEKKKNKGVLFWF